MFKEYKFNIVFHLAAQTHPPTSFKDPIGTWETNVMGSINLITCLQDHQPSCHFIFCSTVEVYGNEGIDGRRINENNVILPANPYGASKCAIDLYVCERMKNQQMKATVIRPFCFTGPRRGARFSIASDAPLCSFNAFSRYYFADITFSCSSCNLSAKSLTTHKKDGKY